jgi:glutaconyl-CoA decarboxylase
MRKFNITVDGTTYQVDVEEITGEQSVPAPKPVITIPAPAVTLPAPAPIKKPAPAVTVSNKAPVLGDGTKLNSPLPGVILSLKASNGDTVKKGQTIIIIEAMKMENDIASPADGILNFAVSQGENVQQNQLLAVIK